MTAQLLHHRLYISKVEESLHFYRQLGMQLIAQQQEGRVQHFFLGFQGGANSQPEYPNCFLELIADPGREAPDVRPQPDFTEGYWKFSIAVADLDSEVARLRAAGVAISDPKQFEDIACLAFCTDPQGYEIEFIQHFFAGNKPKTLDDSTPAVPPTLLLTTLRVADIDRSLAFYRDKLGMSLLSRQYVTAADITLYFLAFTEELPPNADIDSIENREWLWQRPYAMIELVHKALPPDHVLRVDECTGFAGLRMACSALPPGSYIDPDGYQLQLV